MIRISVRTLLDPSTPFAAGATLGQTHFSALLPQLLALSADGECCVLDYADVEDASASYVKATLLAFNQCGRLATGGITASEALGSRVPLQALNCAFMVVNANVDVRDCINDVFAANGAAIVSGKEMAGEALADGEVLGVIEPKALLTLQFAAEYEEVTAAALHAQSDEGIGVTSWNNRLSDLHRQLLLRRQTSGRQHTYCPLVRGEVSYGKVLSGK